MTQASPDHIREYVAEFRREFVTGARSDFTAAERKQLGLLPYLRNCACLGVTSSVYGAGYLFQPGTRDEFLDIGRPVYATLAQPSLTLALCPAPPTDARPEGSSLAGVKFQRYVCLKRHHADDKRVYDQRAGDWLVSVPLVVSIVAVAPTATHAWRGCP